VLFSDIRLIPFSTVPVGVFNIPVRNVLLHSLHENVDESLNMPAAYYQLLCDRFGEVENIESRINLEASLGFSMAELAQDLPSFEGLLNCYREQCFDCARLLMESKKALGVQAAEQAQMKAQAEKAKLHREKMERELGLPRTTIDEYCDTVRMDATPDENFRAVKRKLQSFRPLPAYQQQKALLECVIGTIDTWPESLTKSHKAMQEELVKNLDSVEGEIYQQELKKAEQERERAEAARRRYFQRCDDNRRARAFAAAEPAIERSALPEFTVRGEEIVNLRDVERQVRTAELLQRYDQLKRAAEPESEPSNPMTPEKGAAENAPSQDGGAEGAKTSEVPRFPEKAPLRDFMKRYGLKGKSTRTLKTWRSKEGKARGLKSFEKDGRLWQNGWPEAIQFTNPPEYRTREMDELVSIYSPKKAPWVQKAGDTIPGEGAQ